MTEAEYHEAMHRVYRACKRITGGDTDRLIRLFRKQVDRFQLKPPPLPGRFEDAA